MFANPVQARSTDFGQRSLNPILPGKGAKLPFSRSSHTGPAGSYYFVLMSSYCMQRGGPFMSSFFHLLPIWSVWIAFIGPGLSMVNFLGSRRCCFERNLSERTASPECETKFWNSGPSPKVIFKLHLYSNYILHFPKSYIQTTLYLWRNPREFLICHGHHLGQARSNKRNLKEIMVEWEGSIFQNLNSISRFS